MAARKKPSLGDRLATCERELAEARSIGKTYERAYSEFASTPFYDRYQDDRADREREDDERDPGSRRRVRRDPSGFRLVYLDRARRVWLPGNLTLTQAEKSLRALKRRGLTAWIVDADGRFVPVKGTRRQPGYLE